MRCRASRLGDVALRVTWSTIAPEGDEARVPCHLEDADVSEARLRAIARAPSSRPAVHAAVLAEQERNMLAGATTGARPERTLSAARAVLAAARRGAGDAVV